MPASPKNPRAREKVGSAFRGKNALQPKPLPLLSGASPGKDHLLVGGPLGLLPRSTGPKPRLVRRVLVRPFGLTGELLIKQPASFAIEDALNLRTHSGWQFRLGLAHVGLLRSER